MRTRFNPPQAIADQHTLIAQRYAGYFIGHGFRAAQQREDPTAIQVESAPWKEPLVVGDDCVFCRRLTDEDAERRVAGYQHAIDIEVLRPHAQQYREWLVAGGDDVPEIEEVQIDEVVMRCGVSMSQANRRRFIEKFGDSMKVRSLPMIDLPLRLKRKLCIEWNHLYRDWMAETEGVEYDAENREFYRVSDEPQQEYDAHLKEWWRASLSPFGSTG